LTKTHAQHVRKANTNLLPQIPYVRNVKVANTTQTPEAVFAKVARMVRIRLQAALIIVLVNAVQNWDSMGLMHPRVCNAELENI
jgi:hypothetical protein